MNDSYKSETIYIAAYGIIKKMLKDGVINRESFERLNNRLASKQSTKPITA